jgi:plastocyanin
MANKLLFRSALLLMLSILFLNADATIHVVVVSSNQFNPNSTSVNVGDTVRFSWVSGSHTTTSVTIPNGAATWDSPMTSNVSQFDYKVTVAGSYSYKCTPHAGGGMVGTFTASTVTGINTLSEEILTSLYPNPFSNELFIEQGNEQPEYTQISISDILGKQIKSISIESLSVVSIGKRRIDVGELPKGIYFVTLKGNGAKAKTIRLVKEGA